MARNRGSRGGGRGGQGRGRGGGINRNTSRNDIAALRGRGSQQYRLKKFNTRGRPVQMLRGRPTQTIINTNRGRPSQPARRPGQSIITKRATIKKNLIPLQQSLQKKQIAQEMYYNTGRGPIKMEPYSQESRSAIQNRSSVHNRLGNNPRPGSSSNLVTSSRLGSTNRLNTTSRLGNTNRLTTSNRLTNRLGSTNQLTTKLSLQTRRGNLRGNLRGGRGNVTRIINRSNLQSNGVLTKKAQRLNNRFVAQGKIQRARQSFVTTPQNLVRSQQNLVRSPQSFRSQRSPQDRSPQSFMRSDQVNMDPQRPVGTGQGNFQRKRLHLQRERPASDELQPTNVTVKLEDLKQQSYQSASSSKHNINAQLNPRLQAEIRMIQSTSSFRDVIPSIPIHPQGAGVTKTSLHQRFSQL